jgi:hydrogenase-4 component E
VLLIIDSCLTLVALLNLALLATSRLSAYIRIFAAQSFLLALLPMALQFHDARTVGAHAIGITAGAILFKVIAIPRILLRLLRSGEIHVEIEPFLGFTASVLFGGVITIASFGLAGNLRVPVEPATDLILSVALATVLIGLLVLVSRLKAITQVLGYLVVENGVFVFGLLLLEQMPGLIELAMLLDLFVAVFIMGIVVYHIRREFDHMDTHLLDALKES